MIRKRGAFTLLEIVITMVILAILGVPIATMIIEHVRATALIDSMILASHLIQKDVATVENIPYSALYETTSPFIFTNYAGYNVDLVRSVAFYPPPPTSTLYKIAYVYVFPASTYPHDLNTEKPLGFLTFPISPNEPGAGIAGGAIASGNGESFYFLRSSAGYALRDMIHSVRMRNTRTSGNITITGARISSTRSGSLTGIFLDYNLPEHNLLSADVPLTSGPVDSQPIISFKRNLIMKYGSQYGYLVPTFRFSTEATQGAYEFSVKFVFYDGSESAMQTWSYTP